MFGVLLKQVYMVQVRLQSGYYGHLLEFSALWGQNNCLPRVIKETLILGYTLQNGSCPYFNFVIVLYDFNTTAYSLAIGGVYP